jgi:hypothetical protein
MPREKYECLHVCGFESYDRNEVVVHESETPVRDINIEGLILKDPKRKYLIFMKFGVVSKEHEVFYRINFVSAPRKHPFGLVAEAKISDFAMKCLFPGVIKAPCARKIDESTPDDIMARRNIEEGWRIFDNPDSSLVYCRESFHKFVTKKKLSEIATDEFILVVRNIKSANPGHYDDFAFQQHIPEALK